jgi:transposase InsO family protein
MTLNPAARATQAAGVLATVIDCASRKVIGWAMAGNYRTPGS